MSKASIVILIHFMLITLSCNNSEIKVDRIVSVEYNSDSTISETKSIAADSTITWTISYENSPINAFIGGKLQEAIYNRPLKSMGAYIRSNDSLLFSVDQHVFFPLYDTIETYQTSGSPMVLLGLNHKDSLFYQDVYVFKPVFCDSSKISLLNIINGEKSYRLKDQIFNDEVFTLKSDYDSKYLYEVELKLWFHESDSIHVFTETINPTLFTIE